MSFLSASREVILAPLSRALDAYDQLGRPELVVIVDHFLDPAVQALVRLGMKRVIEEVDFSEWLQGAGPLLRSVSRGRRAERLLRHGNTSWSGRPLSKTTAPAPLFAAEQRFRETYIRAILGIAGSRREAARIAGVPYRTFCQMVAACGITPEDERDPRPVARAKSSSGGTAASS